MKATTWFGVAAVLAGSALLSPRAHAQAELDDPRPAAPTSEERGIEASPESPAAGEDLPGWQRLPDKQAQSPRQQAGAKQAPDKMIDETASDAQQRTHTPRQVSGVVLGTKTVEVRGAGERNLIVLIKTTRGDRRLAIDLGPAQALAQANVTPGARIAAEGYVVALRDQQFLVATRVMSGDQVFDVRRPAQARLHRSRGAAQPATPQRPQEPAEPQAPQRSPLPPEPLPGDPVQEQPSGSY